MDTQYAPIGANKDERRPGADGIGAPETQLGIMYDRMGDPLAEDGLADARWFPLVRKLRRVHADDDQFTGIALLDRPQRGQDVQAVDSTVGPKVEDHEPTGQVGESERPRDIEPDESRWEFWSMDWPVGIIPALHSSASSHARRQGIRNRSER